MMSNWNTFPMPDSLHPLMKQLFVARKQKGISYHELSLTIGLDLDTFYRWFRNKRMPKLDNFIAAADALGFDVVLVERTKGHGKHKREIGSLANVRAYN